MPSEDYAQIEIPKEGRKGEGGGSVRRMLFFLRNPGDKRTSPPLPPRWVTCVGLDVRVD